MTAYSRKPGMGRSSILAALAMLLSVACLTRLTVAAESAEGTHSAKTEAKVEGHKAEATAPHEEEKVELVNMHPGLTEFLTAGMTIVVFVLLVAILSKYAWGPIVSGLKAREDKIRKDIRDAEEARLKADKSLKQYEAQLATAEAKVRDILAKASADAQQLATSIRMNAQQEAEEAKERAAKEIEAAKNQAIAEIYEQAATLATTVAEKILRRNLNADDQRDLVRSSLEQVQTVNAN